MPEPPEENTPPPKDPKDVKKATEETKKQAKANRDAADAAKSAADATRGLADETKASVDAGKEEVKLTKEQIEQKKKLAEIAAKAKADKKEAIEAGKTQAAIAKSFEKISFMGIFKARVAMKGFMKSLKTMDGMKIETKVEGIGDLGEAFSKLSSLSFFGAKRAKRGLMILGGALVGMQKMSEGPLEITTTGLDGMAKMVESMGNMGHFAGRRMKKFLKTFIGYLSPFMHDIAKLETGPSLDPVFKLIDAFSKFADKGRKANKSVKILAKSIGTLMGMKIKKGKDEKSGVDAEEEEREKLRLENERNEKLIAAITGLGSKKEKKGGGLLAKMLGGLLSIIMGIFGLITKVVLMKGILGSSLKAVSGIFGSKNKSMAKTAKKTTGIFEDVINSIKKLINSFIEIVKKVVRLVGKILKKIVDVVVNSFKKIGKGIASVIQSLLEGLGKGLVAVGNPKALVGALALLIIAAGIFVLAKAFVEFTKVDFASLLVGIIAIVALTAAMVGIGLLMMSGIGAVAILAGAAAFLIMAFAAMALGKAFTYLGEGIAIIMVGLSLFVETAVAGFVALAQPGIALGLLGAAVGIIAVTAAITAFIAVLTLAGAASAAGGIATGILGSIGSFFGGPGPPPGPFEMLDKFIGFAAAAPFLTEGAKAINEIGAALHTFLGMNFAAVGAELGQLAMILLSFDAVHMGIGGGIGGGILGMLTFGIIKAKSPLDILKELAELAPDIDKLGNGIFKLAQGLQMLSGVSSGNLKSAAVAVGDIGNSHKQDLSRFSSTTNSSELARLQGLRARVSEKGPRSGSLDSKKSYERKLELIDKSISQLTAKLSTGGYAAGSQMDSSTRRLQDSKARANQQAMTPRYQEVNTMQVNQTQQYLGGMSARSPSVDDDDI